MENNEKILSEILENTKKVKEVVVKKFDKPKKNENEKTAKQKAEAKFKMIGAKFNQQKQAEISKRIEELGVNTNTYIKNLVERDLAGKIVDEELFNKYKEELRKKTEQINILKGKLKQKEEELIKISNRSLFEVLRLKIIELLKKLD